MPVRTYNDLPSAAGSVRPVPSTGQALPKNLHLQRYQLDISRTRLQNEARIYRRRLQSIEIRLADLERQLQLCEARIAAENPRPTENPPSSTDTLKF